MKSILKGIGVLIFLAIVVLSTAGTFSQRESRFSYREAESEERTIDRDDAIYDHWDEIKEYFTATETIQAYSYQAGNTYDLDADISNGTVETIYFPNGGYLYFSANIDENGHASDFDYTGREWGFDIDMESSAIDEAIEEWADANDYIIE